MAEAHVTQHALDVLFKLEAESLATALSAYFGLALPPIVRHFPTELPRLDLRMERLDSVFELADTRLLHMECQSTFEQDDLLRFMSYDVGLYQRERRLIETVVFYGPQVRNAESELSLGSVHYRVTSIFLGQRDGQETYERLRASAARGSGLGEQERLDLLFLPLMTHRRPLQEVVRMALELSGQMPDEAQRARIAGGLLALAYHYIGVETFNLLLEELMATDLLETVLARSLQQGLDQGMAQGMAQARREDILKALRSRGLVPSAEATDRLAQVSDAERLSALFDVALQAGSSDEFERALHEALG